jgi:hypothetical protein
VEMGMELEVREWDKNWRWFGRRLMNGNEARDLGR